MTLDQAIQAAKNGDIGAMKALGKFYFEQKQPSDAVEWYFLAAQHGDFLSAQQATALYYAWRIRARRWTTGPTPEHTGRNFESANLSLSKQMNLQTRTVLRR